MLVFLMLLVIANIVISFILLLKNQDPKLLKFERAVRDEIFSNRQEMSNSLKSFCDSISNQLIGLTHVNEQKLDNVRTMIEDRLKSLQIDNSQKLEQMRLTVDEKLHNTLERRLGDSFKIVSERLEMVRQGLGEMQVLATGVGDLKKVLTNVKTRGTWGEIQLGALLEQILTPEQYAVNISTKKEGRERVEFAIKIPNKNNDILWLPIDAKFPKEDYERLLIAQDKADAKQVEECANALEIRIKTEARSIRDKYISPPSTTDFAIMFLSTEGLFAEVIRRPGLTDILQREYRVIVTGPTTIAALLNSLQVGFRTLAIEKRTSEVWKLLAAVKAEFGRFGDLLDKTHKQLSAVSNSIEGAAKKSRNIERKLKGVQELPVSETVELLPEQDVLKIE